MKINIIKIDEKIKILDEVIDNIENNNYSSELIGYGISYSKEITRIFDLLNHKDINKIFIKSLDEYSFDRKKELEKNTDPEKYDLIDCVVYFNFIWHLEGSGISSGIVNNRIEQGKYLRALKQFKSLLKEYKK